MLGNCHEKCASDSRLLLQLLLLLLLLCAAARGE